MSLGFTGPLRLFFTMGTIQDYFVTDFGQYAAVSSDSIIQQGLNLIPVKGKALLDFSSGTKFCAFFVPTPSELSQLCSFLIDHPDIALNELNNVEIHAGLIGLDRSVKSSDLTFSGRVFVYSDGDIPNQNLDAIQAIARTKGIYFQFRGAEYAKARAQNEHPVAFISHDSRDKENIAHPLAIELVKNDCPVWYDEFSLKVGDNLRESIERGIRECKKCVLVITSNFLNNPGWTKTEFDAIFTREQIQREHLILPVWCNVNPADVFAYSPVLANRVAAQWSDGPESVANQLRLAIKSVD